MGSTEIPINKKLSYARRRFSDADLEALPMKDAEMPYEEVDFSQNDLSVEGLRKVLQLCQCCTNLRVLKLYKNNIDNEGAKELAKFLRTCSTLEELHLSHNRFTIEGVEDIVAAAAEARKEDQNPLWCRLEQNDVKNPEKAIGTIMKKYSVCERLDARRCTVKTCVKNCKVHLPHFEFQKGCNKGGGKGNGGKDWGNKEEWYDDRNSSWDRGRDNRFNDAPQRFERGGGRVKDERSPPRRPVRMEPAERVDERPTAEKRKLKMSGGIFLRAMGAALAAKKADPEAEEGKDGEPPAKKAKVNLASQMLSRAGVITRKKKVLLTEAKKEGGAASGDDEDSGEEGAPGSADGKASGSEADAGSGSEAEKPAKSGAGDASSAKGSDAGKRPASRPAVPREQGRRQASPPRRQQQQSSPPRRGGASPRLAPRRRSPPPRRGDDMRNRRAGPDRSPPRRRGMDGPPRRGGDLDRRGGRGMDRSPRRGIGRGMGDRRAEERRGEGRRDVRGGGGGRRQVDDRSRSPRRAPARREEEPRRRHGGAARAAPRAPSPLDDESPPPRRDPEKTARAAATARAEKLVEDLRVNTAKKSDKKDADMEPAPKGRVAAARPKGRARAGEAGGAKAGAKAAAVGAEAEYSYTEEYSYTDASDSEAEKVGAAKAVRPAK